MSSGNSRADGLKWPHAKALFDYIDERRDQLGLTWEMYDQDIREADGPRFGKVTTRSIHAWAKGQTEAKYKNVMAALIALDLDEPQAFEIYERILLEHNLVPKTVDKRRATALRFPAEEIRRSVLRDVRINHLPAVFETGGQLPVATTFVDLRVVERRAVFRGELLQPIETPGQQIWQRERRLRLPRRSAYQVLDASNLRPSIVIGGPGSGKSALMRRIALDVAEGEWRGAATPLFVELRRFWARREAEPGSQVSLIGYALEQHMPRLQSDPENRDRLEQMILRGDAPGVLLLADGLDEIAALPDAVTMIYDELEGLTDRVRWIGSSRPTGLHRMIGGARRLELDPLSIDAIERLVLAWSAASDAPAWFAGAIYAEIAASVSLRQMAGNPFLLTALCYLRFADLDRELPDSRSEIYQRLFEQIARQAQRRHSDTRILDGEAMNSLEQFCHALYANGDVPKQVFSSFDWQRHGSDAVDFYRRILPARLLSSLNELDSDYHFIHLSLQEHLIARALLDRNMPDILSLRFYPAWRSVFRAYGALLYQTGQRQVFGNLVRSLFEETDLLGVSLFNLAEIFSDAGVCNTTEWIGEDLREKLWDILTEGWNELPAQALEALGTLDAGFLESNAMVALSELEDDLAYLKSEYPEDFETATFAGEPYQQYGFDETHFPRVLARAGTDTAHAHVRNLFLSGPQHVALAMATAFADIARPSDRIELARLAEKTEPDSDFGCRLFAFAVASPAAELAPFLCRVVQLHAKARNNTWDRALGLLMQIGGEEVLEFLKELLSLDIAAWNAHSKALREASGPIPKEVAVENNNLVGLIARFQELDVEEHGALLDLAGELLDTERYRPMLYGEGIKMGRFDDAGMIADLDNPERRDEALSALIRAPARSGKAPSQAIRVKLLSELGRADTDEVTRISEIEAAAIRAGGPAMAGRAFIAKAQDIWDAFRLEPDAAEFAMLIARLDALLSPAQAAQDIKALDLIYDILADHGLLAEVEPDLAEDLLSMLLDYVRDILDGLPEQPDRVSRFGDLFGKLMFDNVLDLTHNAAAALGYLDLPALLALRGASTVDTVLEEISAERDVMIFDTFWAGSDGVIHQYEDKRPGLVVLAQDDRGDEAASGLKHQLVGQGYAFGTLDDLKRRPIRGVILLGPDDIDPDIERAAALDEVVEMLRHKMEVPILACSISEVEDDPKGVAVKMNFQIASLYAPDAGVEEGR